ncbi:hypothetical protein Gogos_009989 [Gossypium gossypioides]|uniref:FAF domain-containing protein n=1 Tax=Gossypium gossypioides TaxID=34282 RepID=A0A7J9BJT3_GOSGO|nr:hypothetical protein [Gossypium gossypioides]
MSSSVSQGLQSCLEVRVVEPRFLSLKLAPHKSNSPASIAPTNEEKDAKLIGNQNMEMGGWSFLHSLSNANEYSTQNDNVYVHPLVKRSASILSEKSLEMCTERLGSETGSDVSDISLLSLQTGVYNPSNSKPRESSLKRKTSRINTFPPPLTSITGSNGVQVKSHREGGRLVLQAVTIPPCHTYFHAERSEGRLRLSLFKDVTDGFHSEDGEEEVREDLVEKEDDDDEDDEDGENDQALEGEFKEESIMREVKLWKEIVGVLGLKLRQGNWLGQADAKKVGVGTKGCLIGSHCWWGDYLKAKSWKVSLNPRDNNYYDWIP